MSNRSLFGFPMLFRCALALLFFCLVNTELYSQPMQDDDQLFDQIATALIECGLIEPGQGAALQKHSQFISSRAGVLHALSRLEMGMDSFPEDTSDEEDTHITTYFQIKPRPVPDEERRAFREYVEKLHRCTLIDAHTAQTLHAKIDDSTIYYKFQLLLEAANLAFYNELASYDKHLKFSSLSHAMDELRTVGLLTDKSYERLRDDLLSNRITSYSEIPAYFSGAFQLSAPDSVSVAEIGDVLITLCNRFAEQMPELAFTDLRYEHTRGENDDPHVLVQFSSNSTTYRHRINLYDEGNADRIAFYLHEIFNKVLTDLRSPLRLATLTETTYPGTDELWIVPIRQAALEVLDLYFHWPWMGIDEYSFNDFTTGRINEVIDTYRDCGLLAHLSEEEFGAARRRVEEKTIRSFSDILKEFPNVIYGFSYDDCGPSQPYERLTLELAGITRGDFAPTSIVDEFDSAFEKSPKEIVYGVPYDTFEFDYGFALGGQAYKTSLTLDWDNHDSRFLDLIVRAMAEQKLPGRFYRIEEGEYSVEIVYLTPLQYERLSKEGLLNFVDWKY